MSLKYECILFGQCDDEEDPDLMLRQTFPAGQFKVDSRHFCGKTLARL